MANEISFEKRLWDAASILRGNLSPAQYPPVILGLIFLKYISDISELCEHAEEKLPDGLKHTVFQVPNCARWNYIESKADYEEIGEVLNRAMLAVEIENVALRGVLPQIYASPEIDKRRLREVVHLFSDVSVVDSEASEDLLGRTYEYCLKMFSENSGKLLGEYYTPASVVETIVKIMKPDHGKIYDPCCGSGGMLMQTAKYARLYAAGVDSLEFYGQDNNTPARNNCIMNLVLRGIKADLGQCSADTFFNDQHKGLKADYIMANPPFNQSDWGRDKLYDDARWRYGVPPAGNANYAWLQHMISHLTSDGEMGIVLTNGSLSSVYGGEKNIRKKIIEEDLLRGIITMPRRMFYTTPISVSIWFLSKKKKRRGHTLFVDARSMGQVVNRKFVELSSKEVDKLVTAFDEFEQGQDIDEAGFCRVVSSSEIAKNAYNIAPERYIGEHYTDNYDNQFREEIQELSKSLLSLFKRSNELQGEIVQRLENVTND